IGRALFSAGWKITKPIGTLQVMGSPTGILLRARDMGSPAAKSLLESLRSVGLDVKPIEQPDYDSDVIALIVGGKPLYFNLYPVGTLPHPVGLEGMQWPQHT